VHGCALQKKGVTSLPLNTSDFAKQRCVLLPAGAADDEVELRMISSVAGKSVECPCSEWRLHGAQTGRIDRDCSADLHPSLTISLPYRRWTPVSALPFALVPSG
jgi:hypothetical protein